MREGLTTNFYHEFNELDPCRSSCQLDSGALRQDSRASFPQKDWREGRSGRFGDKLSFDAPLRPYEEQVHGFGVRNRVLSSKCELEKLGFLRVVASIRGETVVWKLY